MNQTSTQPEPSIPASLAGEIRAAHRADGPIPDSLDQAILAAARVRVGQIGNLRRRRVVIARIAAVSGLAAAVAVAALLWPQIGGPRRPAPPAALSARDPRDVNGDGVVDILDAFAIAKAADAERAQSGRGGEVSKQWDINHDGVVDRRDADAVAISVVRLTPGRG